MSDPTCPGCGAEEYVRTDVGKQYECVEYECGSRWWPNAPNRPPLHRNVCFTRQLARRDERIKELEARALRMERALRTIEAWPFNIMGDCVADARALARKALEEADDAVC